MSQVQEYKLEMTPGHAVSETVYVSQGDELWRELRFRLCIGGEDFGIPSGASAYLVGRKPDGIYIEGEICTDEPAVYFNINDGMCDIAGPVLCKIMIEKEGARIFSAPFIMMVEPSPDWTPGTGPRVGSARVDISRLAS